MQFGKMTGMSDIKIEFSDYVESRTPVDAPDGTELIPVSKDGSSARMTSAQIASLVVVPPSEDDFIQSVVDTTGDTITLDFEDKVFGNFAGGATFLAPRTVVRANEDRAIVFDFMFEVTEENVPIDFGEDTRSTSAMFADGVFTPQDVGLYKVHGTRYGPGGVIWILDFRGVYSVGDAPPTPTDQWILSTGIWKDSEFWDDDAIWKDLP